MVGGPTETISLRALLVMDVDGAAVGARRVSLCHQTLQVAAPARSGDGSLEYKELSIELFTETEEGSDFYHIADATKVLLKTACKLVRLCFPSNVPDEYTHNLSRDLRALPRRTGAGGQERVGEEEEEKDESVSEIFHVRFIE